MVRLMFLLLLSIIGVVICNGKERRDSLWTVDGDLIILTYDIRQTEDDITIRFLESRKILGKKNAKEYKEHKKINVVFFDKIGVYKDMTFTITDNNMPDALSVSNVEYKKSDYGYFFLYDNPTISFKKKNTKLGKLSIPIYLAYNVGKCKYKLFSVCKTFEIEFKSSKANLYERESQLVTETVTTTMEVEDGNEETTAVLSSINTVEVLLENQTKLPFSDLLQFEINKLRQFLDNNQNGELALKIKSTLASCDVKKSELEEIAKKDAEDADLRAQILATEKEERAIARQDSIMVAQERKAEAEKKRNLWLIIGGVLLAGLCFVGNLFLQHFRSVRNQRNMFEMQQNIAHQAEYEAKRHAQNYARKKTNEAANKVKQKGRDMKSNKTQSKSSINKSKPRNFSI